MAMPIIAMRRGFLVDGGDGTGGRGVCGGVPGCAAGAGSAGVTDPSFAAFMIDAAASSIADGEIVSCCPSGTGDVSGTGTNGSGSRTGSGTIGRDPARGTESSISGSMEWMICSMGRSLRSNTGALIAGTGSLIVPRTFSGSAGFVLCAGTLVPHRLQNVDSGGIRLPHRGQNDPCGRDVVSMGWG